MIHKCPKCAYMSMLKANLTRHCIRIHSLYENVEIENGENFAIVEGNIANMGENFAIVEGNIANMGENFANDGENIASTTISFQCNKCNKIMSSKQSLQRHITICKGITNPLECHLCHKVFAFTQGKIKHLKKCISIPIEEILEPQPIQYKKKQIPQSVRIAVWDKYIGRAVGETNCTVCNTTKISQFNFHCGHVIAEKNGGDICIENLKPICKSCNSSMRTMNLDEYKQQYFK